jgi:dTDP-4-amino-4,6-dideoxygalactose transaminase
MINVFQPALGTEELDAVRKVFESNWPGKGHITDRFEAEFARHLGTDRELVRSVSCCTEGLFMAVRLMGVGSGDEVILPSISFVGAANAIVASGARPVFCDVDRASLNVTPDAIESCVNARTKGVLILHYGGVPCDMDGISELVARSGLSLIEDNACSVASRFRGTACGTFSDVSVWSFDSMKALVTGDGGMIRCRTTEWAERAERMLYLGLESDSGFQKDVETRWWEFEVACCGRRAILNDIASAIGIEQLKKLTLFLARRREIHHFYDAALSGLDWLTCPPPMRSDSTSSYYLYWIQARTDRRDRLATHLRRKGIYSTFRYFPLHRMRFYDAEQSLPNAEQAADETLCLPLHPSLSDDDLEHIAEAIREFEPGT